MFANDIDQSVRQAVQHILVAHVDDVETGHLCPAGSGNELKMQIAIALGVVQGL